jgi:hypothetical protein
MKSQPKQGTTMTALVVLFFVVILAGDFVLAAAPTSETRLARY